MAIKKKIALGDAGIIGHALCNKLRSKGQQVISLDLKTGFDLRKDSLDAYSECDFLWFLARMLLSPCRLVHAAVRKMWQFRMSR